MFDFIGEVIAARVAMIGKYGNRCLTIMNGEFSNLGCYMFRIMTVWTMRG